MKSLLKTLAFVMLAGMLISGCGPTKESAGLAKAVKVAGPVNDVRADGLVANWNTMVFTVTSESDRSKAEEYFKKTFDKDYLTSLGGEAKAVLATGVSVKYKNADGNELTATVEPVEANAVGWVASEWDEGQAGRKVPYAFCYLRSDKPQKVKCYFGSDDEAKIWVNGKLVHKTYEPRSCEARTDEFTVELHKGLNPLMVKTSQRSASWVFVLEVYPVK